MILSCAVGSRTFDSERVEANIARVVSMLASRPHVKRIWLFGSATGSRPMDARSDLDIGVEGLDPYALFGAWSEIEAQIDLPLDLVRVEEVHSALREQITKGRLLYEAPT